MNLIGTKLIEEIVQVTLLTGRVRDCSPVSVFLIADPESGKTTIVSAASLHSAIIASDVTGSGLYEVCQYRPEISHIILNDLTLLSGHSSRAASYLIFVLNMMMEEGIKSTFTPGGEKHFEGDRGKRGIIACTTPEIASDHRRIFHKIGFISRVVPIHYKYSKDLVIRIKDSVCVGLRSKPLDWKVPGGAINVACSPELVEEIRKISDNVAMGLNEYGIRRLKQFIAMTKAHALLRTWKSPRVSIADTEWLKSITEFMSFVKPMELK